MSRAPSEEVILLLPRRSTVCLRTCDDVGEFPSCMGENENSCEKEKKERKSELPVDIVSDFAYRFLAQEKTERFYEKPDFCAAVHELPNQKKV